MADGQEEVSGPFTVRHDSTLTRSLINRRTAMQIASNSLSIEQQQHNQVLDSTGKARTVTGSVTLQYYYESTPLALRQTFYIVEDTGHYDFILMRGTPQPSSTQTGYAIFPNVKKLTEHEKKIMQERTLKVAREKEERRKEELKQLMEKINGGSK